MDKKTNAVALRVLGEEATYCLSKNIFSDISMTALIRGNENGSESSSFADEIFTILDFKHNIDLPNNKIISILSGKPIYASTENGLIHYNIRFTVQINDKGGN